MLSGKMYNCNFKKLVIVQSACVVVFLLHYYIGSANQDTLFKSISNADSVKRELHDDYEAKRVDLVSTIVDRRRLPPPGQGGLSGCTLADIEKRPGVMLLTTTNTGYLDITLNMLESIKRAGVCVNTTIIAEDGKAYNYLHNAAKHDEAVRILKTKSGNTTSKELGWNSPLYLKLVMRRHAYLLGYLQQGFEVLFCDSDNFWFQDPFPHFEGDDFDAAMFDELLFYPYRDQNRSLFCDGLAYYKPREPTITFVTGWVQNLLDDPTIPDQNVMNDMLRNNKPVRLDIRTLNPSLFPGGVLYYKRPGWRKLHHNTVVMHSTSIFGRENKVRRYKKEKMWLVDPKVSKKLPKP